MTAGTETGLKRRWLEMWPVATHYQPGFLFVPFGIYDPPILSPPAARSRQRRHPDVGRRMASPHFRLLYLKLAMNMFHYTKADLYDGVDA